jgi:chromate reductase
MYPVNRPEVMMPFAADKVDPEGNLKDEMTKKLIKELLESLVAHARRLGKG